jgi:hypothetical protein
MKTILTTLLTLFLTNNILSQTVSDDSLNLIKRRKEAYDYYSNSYKNSNKEVYIQNIRKVEPTVIINKNYYYNNPMVSRNIGPIYGYNNFMVLRNSGSIYGYNYYPYYSPLPLIRFGHRHHR